MLETVEYKGMSVLYHNVDIRKYQEKTVNSLRAILIFAFLIINIVALGVYKFITIIKNDRDAEVYITLLILILGYMIIYIVPDFCSFIYDKYLVGLRSIYRILNADYIEAVRHNKEVYVYMVYKGKSYRYNLINLLYGIPKALVIKNRLSDDWYGPIKIYLDLDSDYETLIEIKEA